MALNMKNGDYLRWSATSIEDLLTIRATEDGRFTDQLFKGSNLSVLIDLLAYADETILYYLNHAASEGQFADAQFYENMNRMVKLLNYFPAGFLTSSVSVTLSAPALGGAPQTLSIPRYATWDAENSQSDDSGFPVSYTMIDDYDFTYLGNGDVDPNFTPTLYNGRWKFHPTIFTAAGTPNEAFTIDVSTNSSKAINIAHPFIDVYVKSNATGVFERWTRYPNLYDFAGPTIKAFQARVDENKKYVLTFGDNVYGRRLTANDSIYVLYLQSNGSAGKVGTGTFSPNPSVVVEGLTESFVRQQLFEDPNGTFTMPATTLSTFYAIRESVSTEPRDFETVDEIRNNAPIWFRSQGKLTTQPEFEKYVLSNFRGTNEVHDVVCMNNTEYMSEFLAWLYNMSKLSSELVYYGYKYSDSCDFNNVYLWVKSSSNGNVPITVTAKKIIQDKCGALKTLTSEVVALDPFMVAFTPCVADSSNTIPSWDTLSSTNPRFGTDYYLVLERERGSQLTVEGIHRRAIDVMTQFFFVTNNQLGQLVDLGALHTALRGIGGVKSVATVYQPVGNPKPLLRQEGVWMARWTPLIARGADFMVTNGATQLNRFQFPFLFDASIISDKIVVTSENFKISTFEF